MNPHWCLQDSCVISVEPVQTLIMYHVRDPNRTHCGEYECRIVHPLGKQVTIRSSSDIGLKYKFSTWTKVLIFMTHIFLFWCFDIFLFLRDCNIWNYINVPTIFPSSECFNSSSLNRDKAYMLDLQSHVMSHAGSTIITYINVLIHSWCLSFFSPFLHSRPGTPLDHFIGPI